MEQSIYPNRSTQRYLVVQNLQFVVPFQSSREYQRISNKCKCYVRNVTTISLLRSSNFEVVDPSMFVFKNPFCLQVIRAIDQISLSYVGDEHLDSIITEPCIEKYNKGKST